MANTLENVSGPNNKGKYTGKLGNNDVEFGRVPEPPAWRTGNQQHYHSQRYWWLKKGDERRSVYILKEEPKEGREVNLVNCIAKHDTEELAL